MAAAAALGGLATARAVSTLRHSRFVCEVFFDLSEWFRVSVSLFEVLKSFFEGVRVQSD